MKCLKLLYCFTLMLSGSLLSEVATASSSFTGQDFIDVASLRSISEIETAKIALQKSSSPDVKAYAQRIFEEQTSELKKLRKLAEAQHLHMASDAELQLKARIFVFQRNGRTFDAAYADMRVLERRKSVNLFREVAERANGDIRLYAIQQLPILMHHLYMAQTLVGDVKNTHF